jgi:hypothetical protein
VAEVSAAIAVLRSAVGDENYPHLEAICERLWQLEVRQVISPHGSDRITRVIAEELVAQRLAIDVANEVADTLTPEDPA